MTMSSPLLLRLLVASLFIISTVKAADSHSWLFASSRPPLTECDCPAPRIQLTCFTDRLICTCMIGRRPEERSFYCDYGLCCPIRRRGLASSSGLRAISGGQKDDSSIINSKEFTSMEPIWLSEDGHEKDEDYKTYLERCGDLEYHTHLYVDAHLYAYATPGSEATEAGCPFVVTHVKYEDKRAVKELIIFPHVEQGMSMMKEHEVASRQIGTFPLARLADAYQQAHPATDNDGSGGVARYDAIANNCGHYMLHLGAALGVKINADIVQFVARRLVHSAGQELANKIRDSAHYFSLFPRKLAASAADNGKGDEAADVASDQHLVETLVDVQAAGLM